MSILATTLSGTGKNLSAEVLLNTFTATLDRNVALQIRLSNIPANDQTITIRVEYATAADGALGSKVCYDSSPKNAVANTTYSIDLCPIWMRVGEKLKIYATSTDGTATNVSYRIDVLYTDIAMGGEIR